MISTAQAQMKTAKRTAIQKLHRELGIEPSRYKKDFRCPHVEKCSRSRRARDRHVKFCTGTWPYIGARYGKAKVSG